MSKCFNIFIGGGGNYYGPTAERDKKIVKELAYLLTDYTSATEQNIQVITGGTPGIPDDFAAVFSAMNCPVIDIVSWEYYDEYMDRDVVGQHRLCWVSGETQKDRRLSLTNSTKIDCAVFVQGGRFSTHEIRLMQKAEVPTVILYGSGGASGGKISYQDWFVPVELDSPLNNENPHADPSQLAKIMLEMIKRNLK